MIIKHSTSEFFLFEKHLNVILLLLFLITNKN
jgi:hypothetical protein